MVRRYMIPSTIVRMPVLAKPLFIVLSCEAGARRMSNTKHTSTVTTVRTYFKTNFPRALT